MVERKKITNELLFSDVSISPFHLYHSQSLFLDKSSTASKLHEQSLP